MFDTDEATDTLARRVDALEAFADDAPPEDLDREAIALVCKVATDLRPSQNRLAARILDIALREKRRLAGVAL